MSKVKVEKVNNKIHQVSDANLVSLWDGRRLYMRRKFNKLIKESKHVTVLFTRIDGTKIMYSTMEDDEIVLELEKAKKAIV